MDTNKRVRLIDLIAVISMGSFAFLLYVSFSLVSDNINKKRIFKVLRDTYEIIYVEKNYSTGKNQLERKILASDKDIQINFNRNKEKILWLYNTDYKDKYGIFDKELAKEELLQSSLLRGITNVSKKGRIINIYIAPFESIDSEYRLNKDWAVYVDNRLVYSGMFQFDKSSQMINEVEVFEYILKEYREVEVSIVYTFYKNNEIYFYEEKY